MIKILKRSTDFFSCSASLSVGHFTYRYYDHSTYTRSFTIDVIRTHENSSVIHTKFSSLPVRVRTKTNNGVYHG